MSVDECSLLSMTDFSTAVSNQSQMTNGKDDISSLLMVIESGVLTTCADNIYWFLSEFEPWSPPQKSGISTVPLLHRADLVLLMYEYYTM